MTAAITKPRARPGRARAGKEACMRAAEGRSPATPARLRSGSAAGHTTVFSLDGRNDLAESPATSFRREPFRARGLYVPATSILAVWRRDPWGKSRSGNDEVGGLD